MKELACPMCREEHVVVTATVMVTPDTFDVELSEIDWNDDSPCTCTASACNHTGTVADFREDNQNNP